MTFVHYPFALIAAGIALDVFAQAVPLEPPAFTEYVASSVRREVGDTAVTVNGPLRLSIGDLDAHLDRVLNYCKSNNSGCGAQVSQFAKAAGQILKQQNVPLDKSAVQLVIRSDEYIKRAQASFGAGGPILQAKPLVAGLMVVAVLDTPRAVRPLDERDLKKLHMQQEQVFELGAENLLASLKPLATSASPAASGQIGHIGPSFGEVGRVALPMQWASLANAQRGELVIALPTTDQVLYISESAPAALDALRTLSRNLASKSQNPLAPDALLKWTAGQWEPVK